MYKTYTKCIIFPLFHPHFPPFVIYISNTSFFFFIITLDTIGVTTSCYLFHILLYLFSNQYVLIPYFPDCVLLIDYPGPILFPLISRLFFFQKPWIIQCNLSFAFSLQNQFLCTILTLIAFFSFGVHNQPECCLVLTIIYCFNVKVCFIRKR